MIIVYSKENCSQCVQAENLLKANDKLFQVKKLDVDFTLNDIFDMFSNAGLSKPRSFPVITKGDKIIGDLTAIQMAIVRGIV